MHKRFFLGLLPGVALPILIIGGLNYLVDPLQFYRKAEFYHPQFSGQQRFRNPGIARNYTYDSVVLGTSTTDYLMTEDIRRVLGWNAVSLRFSGGTAFEQRKMFQVVARQHKARNIMWALDYASYAGPIDEKHNSSLFPEYLYGSSRGAILPYLVNLRIFYWSIENLLRSPKYASLQEMEARQKVYDFSRKRFTAQIARLRADRRSCKTPPPSPTYRNPNLDALVAAILQHPDLNFYLFFPPYSALRYSTLCLSGGFREMTSFRHDVMRKLTSLTNVRLYDFQSVPHITHNLDNYKDDLHYSPGVGRNILESIRDNRHRVYGRNQDQKLIELSQQTKEFVRRAKAQATGR